MTRLRRVLGLGPGEGGLAALVTILMLVASLGAAMGAAGTEALFFARFDMAYLPQMYVALGAVTFVITLGVSGLLARPDRRRLYAIVPAVLAGALLVERLLVVTGMPWVYPALWLAMNVLITLQGIVAWGVASAVCDTRQAKRLFPLFNAGKIAGLIAGGVLTTAVVGSVHAENLLLVWCASLAAACVVVVVLFRDRRPLDAPQLESRGLLREIAAGYSAVSRSDLLRLLALSLVLFSVLFFSLALPFTRAVRAELVDEDRIAGFLGLFGGATTAAALLASLFGANRFYARFGVVAAIVVFTAIYLTGFAVLAVAAGFAVLVAVRFVQMTWLTGVADTAYQALFSPVPADRRDQTRAFMEGVPGQAGIAIAGVLLIVGDRALQPRQLYLVGLVAAAAALALVWRTRAAYRRALADALRAGRPQPFLVDTDPLGVLARDPVAVGVARAGLTDDDPHVRRVAVDVMAHVATAADADALFAAAGDVDEDVRSVALRVLRRIDPVRAAEAATTIGAGAPPRVRAEAAVTLRDSDAIQRLVDDEDAATREGILDALAGSTDRAVRATGLPLVHDPSPAIRARAIETFELYDADVRPLLDDPDPRVATAAIRALARAGSREALIAFAHRERDAALPDIVSADGSDAHAALIADALRERAKARAIRALTAGLALAGRLPDDLVVEALDRGEPAQRASALELVEAAADPDIVRPLLALWEPAEGHENGADLIARAAEDDDPAIRELVTDRAPGGIDMQGIATLSTLDRILFMKRVPLFAMLPPADLAQIAKLATEHVFTEGTTVVREGDVGDRLYVIVHGTVRVIANEKEIARRGEGEYVGELSLITGEPRSATLVASADTRCLCINRREFEAIVRDRPQVGLAVIRVLSARLRELQESARQSV